MPNGADDVANGAPHPQQYTDNLDGTVTDNVTGLMWQQGYGRSSSQSDAATVCDGVTAGGYRDWRLPAMIELVSIVDYSRATPSIDPIFGGTPPDPFWTSTSLADTSPTPLSVYFQFGAVLPAPGPSDGVMPAVRCVR